jgi:hypothetical protein
MQQSSRDRAKMIELLKTNDIILISRVESLLEEHGIEFVVFDAFMSVMEGSIGAIPRRIMVRSDDLDAARNALSEAGLGQELP